MEEKEPMKCVMDLDWSNYTCPCGETFCTRHQNDKSTQDWINNHWEHTNGMATITCSENGNRAYGGKFTSETMKL